MWHIYVITEACAKNHKLSKIKNIDFEIGERLKHTPNKAE